jgi:glutaredoxin-like YruB-family protein
MEKRKVIVYSTPSCPFCNNLRTYLRQKGIEFEEYDVSKDKERLVEMIQKSGGGGVPVVDIDGIVIRGFDPDRIEKALNGMRLTRDDAIRNLAFDPFDR